MPNKSTFMGLGAIRSHQHKTIRGKVCFTATSLVDKNFHGMGWYWAAKARILRMVSTESVGYSACICSDRFPYIPASVERRRCEPGQPSNAEIDCLVASLINSTRTEVIAIPIYEAVMDSNVLVSALRSKRAASHQLVRLIGCGGWRLNIQCAAMIVTHNTKDFLGAAAYERER